MDIRRIGFIVLVVLLLLGGGIAFLVLRPQVAGVSPAPDEVGLPVHTTLGLSFTRPMQPDSVLERLTIEPEIEGEFTWEGNTLNFVPAEAWPHGIIVNLRLAAGAKSKLGLPMIEEFRWAFSTSNILLAYLSAPADTETIDIHTLDLLTGQFQQLTESGAVLDFDATLDGSTLYYSEANTTGGSRIMRYERLSGESDTVLDCRLILCQNVSISPDQTWLAYESTLSGNISEVWLFALQGTDVVQLSAAGHKAYNPQWSPRNQLAYYDAAEQAFIIYDPATEESMQIPNETGQLGAWSPDGDSFIIPEMYSTTLDILRGPTGEASLEEVDPAELKPVEVLSSHLLKIDLADGSAADLTVLDQWEDAAPAYAPDGRLLAFARRAIDPEQWTPGRQLWIMHPDGSDAQQLSGSPDYKYLDFAWHPNGQQIAYVRASQTELTEPIELWVMNVDGSNPTRLVVGGYEPQWIP